MLRKVIYNRWHRAWLVGGASLGFVLGAASSRWLQLHDLTVLAVLGLVVVVGRRTGLVFAVGLIAIAFVGGCWRGTQYMDRLSIYQHLQKRTVVLTGVATGDSVYGAHSQLSFEVKNVYYDGKFLDGKIQVSGFGVPMIYGGDTVRVQGKLLLSRGNDVARISFARLEVLKRGGSPVDDLRRRFAAGLQSAVPEPLASFGMGLLVGQRNTLPEGVTQQLQMVGLTHIIAVSGYNLTIIMRAAKMVFGKRSKYQYMVVSISFIVGFLMLAGASPSIVRASVVCGLSLTTWYYGRELRPIPLILLAAAITVLLNPPYAWNNISWTLSFLAFFGVLVIAPIVSRRLYKGREPPMLQSIVLESLAAEVMTIPYILMIFGQVSLVSTLANLLVAAFIPLAMLLCVVAGLAGMWLPAFAGWLSWPATLLLTYMLDVVALLSRIPHAFLQGIGYSNWMLLASYALVGLVGWLAWKKVRENDTITDRNQ